VNVELLCKEVKVIVQLKSETQQKIPREGLICCDDEKYIEEEWE